MPPQEHYEQVSLRDQAYFNVSSYVTSYILVTPPSVTPSQPWFLATVATHHLIGNKSFFKLLWLML